MSSHREREPAGATVQAKVISVGSKERQEVADAIAVEEPLEIRVVAETEGSRERHSIAVTMRTPGHDFELAAGFLLSEGAVKHRDSIWRIAYCESDKPEQEGNIVEVHLAPSAEFDVDRFSRLVYTSSSCGICGKASIDAIETECSPLADSGQQIAASTLLAMPSNLRAAQPVFSTTGGLHAAGLFSLSGELSRLREDVGRHNAVDKLIGFLLLADSLPASESVLLVSGRASFELVQKCLAGGIAIMAAVGAPSSLAIELAERYGLTLAGFLREDRFNIYSGKNRIRFD